MNAAATAMERNRLVISLKQMVWGERESDDLTGHDALVDATEIVVGSGELGHMVGIVGSPERGEEVADEAALAVTVYGCGYQSVDIGAVGLTVDSGEVAGSAHKKLSRGVDCNHIVDEFGHYVIATVYVVGDIFVCEEAVGIGCELFFQCFIHGRFTLLRVNDDCKFSTKCIAWHKKQCEKFLNPANFFYLYPIFNMRGILSRVLHHDHLYSTHFTLYMIERLVIIDSADPASFYGVNNSNMQLIRNLFPKLRIAARGQVIKVIGEEKETAEFEQAIHRMEQYCARHNSLTDDAIIEAARGETPRDAKTHDGMIIFGINGKPISARNANQQRMVESFSRNDLTFALGPAGTGKTYIAIALAVKALKNKEARRIILSRPAVEAGEKLGFLPGDMKDKIDPYLQPLYDALEDMIPQAKLKEYMETNVIQIAPLAFMRGRTLNDAIIVLDEAQNTTTHQIKMFLTRLGMNAKMIVTGDVTQIDLPRSTQSGLIHVLKVLKGVPGIGRIDYDRKDIVRHPLVQRIVDAYDRYDRSPEAIADGEAVDDGVRPDSPD